MRETREFIMFPILHHTLIYSLDFTDSLQVTILNRFSVMFSRIKCYNIVHDTSDILSVMSNFLFGKLCLKNNSGYQKILFSFILLLNYTLESLCTRDRKSVV